MDTTQVLIIVAAVAVALLLIIIALRLAARRRVKAMTPEQRDLHYAERARKKRVSELKADLKAVEKDGQRAVKDARSRLESALAIGTDQIDAVKGPSGTVALTSRTLETPSGTRDVTPDLSAEATAAGSPATAEGAADTRRVDLVISDADGTAETVAFRPDQESDVRGFAARVGAAAHSVDEVLRQRDDAVREAEEAVTAATEQATVRMNEAQARYDKGIAEADEKVRAAEATVRERRIR
ncbi:hypothetical protein [Demequina sp. NBRC 110053]|uniref:hypothetical protein n=1 Tax=Demequina sp. NBRC 110053 TaxID=1570342 RepID=UPI000A04235C|nr:hypothetical protein [Demequina sp. NBRC 110053]